MPLLRPSTRRFARRVRPAVMVLAACATLVGAGISPAEEAKPDPALEKYYVANGAYNRQFYPVAITQYEAFLAEHGDHPKADLARQGLALSQYALKQYEKAMPPLAALLGKQKLDDTISRERLVMLQGQCLLFTGKPEESRKLFVAELGNLKSDAYRTGALAAICDVCFKNGEWAEVVTWSTKLLGAQPSAEQSARGLYQQGYAHYQLKEADAAVAALDRIAGLKAGPGWATRAAYLLGECHNLREDHAKAEASFLAALPGLEGADAAECRYRLGLTRFVLKNYKEAAGDLGAFLAAAGDNPLAPEAALYLARAQLELGDYAKAEPALTELGGGDGETAARAGRWLARVHTRRDGNYDRAAEILGKTVQRFGASAIIDELRFDYANALMARSDPDWKTALALLQELEAGGDFPQIAEVVSQRAVCQHKLGDYTASLAGTENFLRSYPDHALAAEARFLRAENLFLLDRPDDARKAYAEFLGKHDGHASAGAATFRLAQVDHDQGRWKECLAVAAPMLGKKPAGRLYEQLPFLVGDCHFRLGQWAEAIAALDTFLAGRVAGDPVKVTAGANVDTALMQLAVAHDRLEQPEKALKFLRTLTASYPEASPQRPLALAELGRLAFETNDLATAREALERFLAEDEAGAEPFKSGAAAQRPRVLYYLGWVEAGEENHAAAAERFAAMIKAGPKHPLAADAALQQGIAWVNQEKFAEAAKHFTGMLQRYPKHEKLPRLVYYAGLALARLEKWREARVHFQRVAESFADSEFAEQALYEWAWCERRADRNAEAVKVYERLLAAHPESPLAVKVQSELAELQLESGAQEVVITRLTEALAKVEDEKLREDIRYQLASAHFQAGAHDTAAVQFEALATDYPQSELLASIRFQAGESRLQLGETEAARAHFGAAAGAPGAPPALAESITMRLAETQALTGRHDEARQAYATFLEKFPESRWLRNARFGLAFALENAGQSEAAIPEYRKLLDDKTIDLWTVRSRFQLGECHFNLRQYEEAVAEFVNVEISYPKYPAWQAKAVLEMARVLIAQDRNEQAAERLKDVIRTYPKEKAATVAQQYLDELRAK